MTASILALEFLIGGLYDTAQHCTHIVSRSSSWTLDVPSQNGRHDAGAAVMVITATAGCVDRSCPGSVHLSPDLPSPARSTVPCVPRGSRPYPSPLQLEILCARVRCARAPIPTAQLLPPAPPRGRNAVAPVENAAKHTRTETTTALLLTFAPFQPFLFNSRK